MQIIVVEILDLELNPDYLGAHHRDQVKQVNLHWFGHLKVFITAIIRDFVGKYLSIFDLDDEIKWINFSFLIKFYSQNLK